MADLAQLWIPAQRNRIEGWGMFLGNVLFLTDRWGLSTFEAGLWLSPGPLLVGPSAVLSGRRADRVEYRSIFIVGSLL